MIRTRSPGLAVPNRLRLRSGPTLRVGTLWDHLLGCPDMGEYLHGYVWLTLRIRATVWAPSDTVRVGAGRRHFGSGEVIRLGASFGQ